MKPRFMKKIIQNISFAGAALAAGVIIGLIFAPEKGADLVKRIGSTKFHVRNLLKNKRVVPDISEDVEEKSGNL